MRGKKEIAAATRDWLRNDVEVMSFGHQDRSSKAGGLKDVKLVSFGALISQPKSGNGSEYGSVKKSQLKCKIRIFRNLRAPKSQLNR